MICDRPANLIMSSHLGIRPLLDTVTVCNLMQVIAKALKDKYWKQLEQNLKIAVKNKQKLNLRCFLWQNLIDLY